MAGPAKDQTVGQGRLATDSIGHRMVVLRSVAADERRGAFLTVAAGTLESGNPHRRWKFPPHGRGSDANRHSVISITCAWVVPRSRASWPAKTLTSGGTAKFS
jgi:hypothetical protein